MMPDSTADQQAEQTVHDATRRKLDEQRIEFGKTVKGYFPILFVLTVVIAASLILLSALGFFMNRTMDATVIAASVQVAFGMVLGFVCVYIGLMMTWLGIDAAYSVKQESMFPPPGEKPQVGELFDPPNDGPPSAEQLMMPPATMMFPRLRKSTWEGFYIDFGGNRRTMTMSLNGTRGEYRAREVDVRGDLTNVQYTSQDGMTIIRGNWGAGRQGNFEFRVMMSNLNEFQGEYWDQNGRRVGVWDGKRTSR